MENVLALEDVEDPIFRAPDDDANDETVQKQREEALRTAMQTIEVEGCPNGRLVNVVATYCLKYEDKGRFREFRLNLKKIAKVHRNLPVKYEPKRLPAMTINVQNLGIGLPKTTALMFASGNVVHTGAKTEEEARLAARCLVAVLLNQQLGIPCAMVGFKITNLVCDTKLMYEVDLYPLRDALGSRAEFKPEGDKAFPAIRIQHPPRDAPPSLSESSGRPYHGKMHAPETTTTKKKRKGKGKRVSLVYQSGAVVIVGGKTREDIRCILKDVCEICAPFRVIPGKSTPIPKNRYRTEGRRKIVTKTHIASLNQKLNALTESAEAIASGRTDKRTDTDQYAALLAEGVHYAQPINPLSEKLLQHQAHISFAPLLCIKDTP